MTARIFRKISDIPSMDYPVFGLGNFDGFHIGHQAILGGVARRAKEKGGTSVALTFSPHPVRVLHPSRRLELLTSEEEKLELIAESGVDIVLSIPFTLAFAAQTPREFAAGFLTRDARVKEVFVGPNYGFGRDRSGNVETLRALGGEFGFDVHVVPAVMTSGQRVSSSLIRELVREGNMDAVIPMLGRPYRLEGKVIEGENRGRALGYPTANLSPEDKVIPLDGVYAITGSLDGKPIPGIAYIGTQPTFEKRKRQLEVHLYDFSGKLYGQNLRVHFYGKVRGEMKFSGRNELVARIGQDIVRGKEILGRKGIIC